MANTPSPKRTGSVRRAEARAQSEDFDPTRPATFDIRAFIAGATSQSRSKIIPVTNKPDVADQLAQFTEQRDKLEAALKDSELEPNPPKRRLAARDARKTRLGELDEQIEALEPQLEGSWVFVKLVALSPQQQDEVRALRLPAGVQLAAAIFERTGYVRPEASGEDDWSTLTAEQWEEFVEAIGPSQYLQLDQAHQTVTYQAVTPDFYERFSASRATRSTSAS